MLFGCGPDSINNPKRTEGIIDSVNYIHWGKGYYYPVVSYRYEIGNSIIRNEFEGELEESYTKSFKAGDSVFIIYNGEDFKQARIEKVKRGWYKIEYGKRQELQASGKKYISKSIVWYGKPLVSVCCNQCKC